MWVMTSRADQVSAWGRQSRTFSIPSRISRISSCISATLARCWSLADVITPPAALLTLETGQGLNTIRTRTTSGIRVTTPVTMFQSLLAL